MGGVTAALDLKSQGDVAQVILGSRGHGAEGREGIITQASAPRPKELQSAASYDLAVTAQARRFGRQSVLNALLVAMTAGGFIMWIAACVHNAGRSAPSAVGASIQKQRNEILRRAANVHALEIDGVSSHRITGPLAPAKALPWSIAAGRGHNTGIHHPAPGAGRV